MGKKLNLSHLTEEECDKIMNVLQKDFEVRRLEKKRINEAHDDLEKEQKRVAVLKGNKNFNETSCIICLERFGVLFHRKKKCYKCNLNVCSVCCQPRSEKKKGLICQVCSKEKAYKILSNQWFYDNAQVSDNTIGSSNVVRSLYKRTTPGLAVSDVDSEIINSPDSSVENSKSHTKLDTLHSDEESNTHIHGNTVNNQSTPATEEITQQISNQNLTQIFNQTSENSTEISAPAVVPRLRTSVQNGARPKSQDFNVPVPRRRRLNNDAFDGAKRAEELKFRAQFDNLMEELHVTLEEKNPDGLTTSFASPSYGEMMLTFKDKVKDLLTEFTERLQLAYESFGSADSPEDTRYKVSQNVCKFLEDFIGVDLELTSDMAISDLSKDTSNDQSTFEDLVAHAVVSKLLENHCEEVSEFLCSSDNKNITEGTLTDLGSETRDRCNAANIENNFANYEHCEISDENCDSVSVGGHESVYRNRQNGTHSDLVPENIDDKLSVNSKVNAANIDCNERKKTVSKYNDRANNKTDVSSEFSSKTTNGTAQVHVGEERYDTNEESNAMTELQEMKDFVKNTSSRPKVEVAVYDDSDLYEVDEKTILKSEFDRDEDREEFHTKFSILDRIHSSGPMLPDISHYDSIDYASDEIDPDLLSLNLAIIPEETEEELEHQPEKKTGENIRQTPNWIFKDKGVSHYSNMGNTNAKINWDGSLYMGMSSPEQIHKPRIGNRNADQLSDFSDLDGSDDEENTFYANTSKELARIALQHKHLGHSQHSPGYYSDDSDFNGRSIKQRIELLSADADISDKSDISSPIVESSKQDIKLLQDLIPAEDDDPKFLVAPESIAIQEGEPANFSCRVVGTDHIDVFWYRETDEVEELEESDDVEISSKEDQHSITIYNISKKLGGQYMCIAMNDRGKAIQYLTVTVKDNKQELKKPEFLKGLSDVEVTEGQSVKFRVKVKGYPSPRINWYKDGKPLKNSISCRTEKFGNRDYILVIDHASMNDDAEYTVIATNIAGEQRMSAQVIVEPLSDLPVRKQNISSTTTSGVSDSDSDRSMSYRPFTMTPNSRPESATFTKATISRLQMTSPSIPTKVTVQENENESSMDRKTAFMSKQNEMSSKKISSSEFLKMAEDIIQHEQLISTNSPSQQLSSHSVKNNTGGENKTTTAFENEKLNHDRFIEDLSLPDILDNFIMPNNDTDSTAQPNFDFVLPKVNRSKILSDQYSRDFEIHQAAKTEIKASVTVESLSPQFEMRSRQNGTDRTDEKGDSSSQCSSPRQSIDSGVYVSSKWEQPQPICIVTHSKDDEIPADLTEFNKVSSIELPSVDKLKAVFSSVQDDDDLGNGSFRRVHSITARSVPKEQLENLKKFNQSQSLSETSSFLEVPGSSSAPSEVSPESLQMNSIESLSSCEATSLPVSTLTQSKVSCKTPAKRKVASTTEVHRSLDQCKDPLLIYPDTDTEYVRQNRTQHSAESQLTSKSNMSHLQTQQHTANEMSVGNQMSTDCHEIKYNQIPTQNQTSTTGKQIDISPLVPQQSKIVAHMVMSNDQSEASHKSGARIKGGCISARAAFWERKIIDGEATNNEEFPEMIDSSNL